MIELHEKNYMPLILCVLISFNAIILSTILLLPQFCLFNSDNSNNLKFNPEIYIFRSHKLRALTKKLK